MAVYLQVENLTKSYGDRLLFDNVTFGINEGEKIGIVAKNGTGKTTLLRIIAGDESADSGKVVKQNGLRVAMLEQLPMFGNRCTVLDACMSGDNATLHALRRYEAAVATGDTALIATATQEMDSTGAWEYDDKLKQLLTQLHIDNLQAEITTLSGGQQKRVALAKVILQNPDLIILDEPTNHLDIDVIEWLEGYLGRSRTTLLMVTHDRYFLDRVCNKIIEIDQQRIFSYKGNFDYYLMRRAERIEALESELAKVKNALRKEQEWMRRQPQARAGKAKYRIDAFYSLKERSQAKYDEKKVALDVNSSYLGSKIAEARHVSKAYGSKCILDDFNYTFARYEKVGIVGVNGVGKSTFIKILLGEIQPDKGEWDVGETVRFGYYSQEGIKFDESKKVIDAVTEIADDIMLDDGRRFSPMQFLQKYLFSPADQQKYIHTLSGGERCRLHLATVMMRSPNFLVLDEPTNDLDIVTLGLLEEYLSEFKGCLVVVSHDRFFLDRIVDHIFVLEGDGDVKDFPGTYSEYKEWRAERAKEAEMENPTNQTEAARRKHKTKSRERLTFKERKELEQLTAEIDALTAEKDELSRLFSSGEELKDAMALSERYTALTAELDEKELRWLELSEKE